MIGAGVIGSAIAAAAIRRNLSVVVVDERATPGFGSTSASAGIARVHAGDVESSILADESIYAWEEWPEFVELTKGEAVAKFVRCGTYILDDLSGEIDKFASVMKAAGAKYSELDGDQLATALPWADTRRFGPPREPEDPQFWTKATDRIERALHTPASGYLSDPALAAQNLATFSRHRGAEFYMGKRVVAAGERRGGGLTVLLNDDTKIHAGALVNAAGTASREVNKMLQIGTDFTIKQRLVRQELHHVNVATKRNTFAHIVDGDLGINFRPEGEAGFLVGSSGAVVDGETTAETPEAYVSRPTRTIWNRHVSRAARRIPALEVPSKPVGVAGLYDVTDDWLPIYDRTERPGIFVAIGTSGNQFKTAPLVGDLMVQLVIAAFEGLNTDDDPLIAELPYTQRRIDLSAFSRRRTPTAGGSRG